jgi:hypothetical protein
MNTVIRALAAALTLAAGAAQAAPPKAQLLDFSAASLIDEKSAQAVLDETIPARLWKVYPTSKWAFVSQVEGGVTGSGICVVTARVMMVPLTPTMKAVLFRPQKIATAYDAQPNASGEQCRQLARAKLGEAAKAVVSSLVKA